MSCYNSVDNTRCASCGGELDWDGCWDGHTLLASKCKNGCTDPDVCANHEMNLDGCPVPACGGKPIMDTMGMVCCSNTNCHFNEFAIPNELWTVLPRVEAFAQWAVERWDDEVKNRPTKNIYRKVLDSTWRQVYRRVTGKELPRPK